MGIDDPVTRIGDFWHIGTKDETWVEVDFSGFVERYIGESRRGLASHARAWRGFASPITRHDEEQKTAHEANGGNGGDDRAPTLHAPTNRRFR